MDLHCSLINTLMLKTGSHSTPEIFLLDQLFYKKKNNSISLY